MTLNQPQLLEIIATLIAFFGAVTFHEFSHALAAYVLGDETAKQAGRLTLNPLKHIDLIGLICLFLFRIGWAKPVPMNMQNFKHPKLYAVLSAFAGPISNFILALVSLYAFKYIPSLFGNNSFALFFTMLFKVSAQLNVMLGIFNFLPIPPLDGGHLIQALIPESMQATYYRFLPVSIIILLIVIMLPATQNFLVSGMNMVLKFLAMLVI